MTLHDLFKSLFGGKFPPSDKYSEFYEPQEDSCDCFDHYSEDFHGNEENEGHFWSFGNIDDMFRHFHSDMRQQMEEMHKQMDDIFRQFGERDFPILDRENKMDRGETKESLRDRMLKRPDSNKPNGENHGDFKSGRFAFSFPDRFRDVFASPVMPSKKRDEDVSDVHPDDIVKLYDGSHSTDDWGVMAEPHSQYSRVSVRISRAPDGTVQEERTVCDSEGHCETTTTTRSPKNDGVSDILPLQPKTFRDPNSYTGIFGTFRKLWPRKSDGNIDTSREDITDESVYDSIFGKK